ncbi:hypothetical protein QCN27_15530 [Cereibacter sp. SYSU M97828]|nr:hypothetical protein [Cereibacter flavus]
MSTVIEHDEWNEGIRKLPADAKIELGDIHGVLPFDGKRDPSGRSSWSQKVFFAYKTPANKWKPKIAMTDSVSEAAAGVQALMDPALFDIAFQPLTVRYRDDSGRSTEYTHDILMTFRNGHRRLVFMRYEASLKKPSTQRAINAIIAATPRSAADDMIVVNAADYTRQRRDNLFRMYRFHAQPDAEADECVLETVRGNRSIRLMQDIFPKVAIEQHRVFQSCYRLVAAKKLHANLDHVLCELSRIGVSA